MKWQDCVKVLSRDHRRAAEWVPRLQEAYGASAQRRFEVGAGFLDLWDLMLAPHFLAEERLLVRFLSAEDVRRLFEEHDNLRKIVGVLRDSYSAGAPDPMDCRRLARALEAHLVWEERHVYDLVPSTATEADVDELCRALTELDAKRAPRADGGVEGRA